MNCTTALIILATLLFTIFCLALPHIINHLDSETPDRNVLSDEELAQLRKIIARPVSTLLIITHPVTTQPVSTVTDVKCQCQIGPTLITRSNINVKDVESQFAKFFGYSKCTVMMYE
jgi:hypothetical protein